MNIIVFASLVFTAGQWISYCNESLEVFLFSGREKAMVINPRDFGIPYPLWIESLRTRFYSAMGGFTDSAFVYKIYAGDGQSLLFESETLLAIRPPNQFVYGLRNPVAIESGNFYISCASRTYNSPFGYPFIATDDNPSPTKSFYGSAGSWTLSEYGELFIFVFVTYNPTGESEKLELRGEKLRVRTLPSITKERFILKNHSFIPLSVKLYDGKGKLLSSFLLEGERYFGEDLPSGIYFVELKGEGVLVREKVLKLQ